MIKNCNNDFELPDWFTPIDPYLDLERRGSLLQYPGGKSRAINIIGKFIPNGINTLCSPFFGGGSIEFACAETGIQVYGYDIFQPLVNFWQCALDNPQRVAGVATLLYPMRTLLFKKLREKYENFSSRWVQAAVFYALNRTSWGGGTFTGGTSEILCKEYTKDLILRLETFKHKDIQVKLMGFTESIPEHKDDFLYLDPPYLIDSNLYGKNGDTHKNFDHELLCEILRGRDKWILSYNNIPEIKDMYKNYEFYFPKWSYCMSSGKNKVSSEILILCR